MLVAPSCKRANKADFDNGAYDENMTGQQEKLDFAIWAAIAQAEQTFGKFTQKWKLIAERWA